MMIDSRKYNRIIEGFKIRRWKKFMMICWIINIKRKINENIILKRETQQNRDYLLYFYFHKMWD